MEHGSNQQLILKRGKTQRYWLPILLGMIVTVAVFGLWQQLLVREQLHIRQLIQQEATAIESQLNRELSTRILALERMASRWQVSGGTPRAFWEADAASYIDHSYGYQAIEWVDPSFHVQWVVPLKGNEAAQNLDLSQEARRRITFNVARDLHQTILTRTISLFQGGKGFLAIVPLYVKDSSTPLEVDRFDGFIVGVFRFQALFDSLLEVSPLYQVQIFDGNGLIYRQETSLTGVQSEVGVVQAYGADWQVQVFATSTLIDRERSPLPNLVLGSGLLSAWALALVVYLGQRSERSIRQAKKINQQLQDEISERQQIENELRRSEAANRNLSDRLNLAVQSAQIAIWDWDITNDILVWDDQMCRLYGINASHFSGAYEAWSSALHPDDFNLATTAIQQAIQGKRDYEPEFRVIHPDGTIRLIKAHAIVQRNAQGQAQRMIGVNFDVTEQKQAALSLQESESTLRSFFNHESMLMGIVELHDRDILHLSDNRTTANFFGTTQAAMKNRFASEMGVPRPDIQRWISAYRKAERTQEPVHFEYPHESSTGQRWLAATVCQIAGGTSQHSRFSYIVEDITDRKQAALALQQSEERFQAFMQNAPLLSWITDSEGKLLYANSAFFESVQSIPEEAIGQSITFLFPEHLAEEYLRNNRQVIETQTVLETVEAAPASDGSIREYLVRKFPIQRQGQLSWVGGIAFDITEHKQAELALQKSEARFQSFMDCNPACTWITDSNGVMLYTNQTYLRTFQLPTLDPIGQSVLDLYPPHVAQQFLDNIQTVTQTQQILEAIEIAPRQDGVMGKFLVYKFPISDLSGQLLVGGAAIDITQQYQAEEELRHQKEMFQVIVDNIPVMIALFNDQGRIDFINPEFERTLGWSLQEWQQRDVMADLYPDPIYLQSVLNHMTSAMGNWRDFTTLTAMKQQIETSWTNVPISKGRFLGIGQDISDRKHKEDALQQAMEAAEAANLAKSMFLANMSHELRTPLSVILGFAQVMAHDLSLTSSQREDLQTIQRSGDHLLSLINDVLDLSKIEAGHSILEESRFDLISLLHTLRTMMAERAKVKQLQLTFDIAPEVPQFVIADEQKLRQILLNLLSNAIKFTKQGSVILRVHSWESIDKVCLAPNLFQSGDVLNHSTSNSSCTLQFKVTDTGVGIAAAEQETIFDAFMQAEAGQKSTGGTGLGLTISRKLLELMNGSISVESTSDVGSTFTVTVPVCPTSGIDGQVEKQERTIIGLAPGQPHHRILVVDDQRENRSLMVRLLTRLGLEVKEAANGQEAITLWQQWKPDLTWMDIRMPDLDGYEATRQIRAMEEKASIIIALTAQASQSDRALALAAGCNDYISKPFREETLFLKLREYLGLEYLYAEALDLPNSPSISTLDTNANPLNSFDPAILAQMPIEWLATLEDLALCGNDKAIVDLANQLAPEFSNFRTQFLDLANRFEFEQIIHLIHCNSSS